MIVKTELAQYPTAQMMILQRLLRKQRAALHQAQSRKLQALNHQKTPPKLTKTNVDFEAPEATATNQAKQWKGGGGKREDGPREMREFSAHSTQPKINGFFTFTKGQDKPETTPLGDYAT